jgi:hypothetical protein
VLAIGEFIGRVPDRPPLRKHCRLVCCSVFAEAPIVLWLIESQFRKRPVPVFSAVDVYSLL